MGGRVARQRANGSRPGGAWEYYASLFWDLWEQLPTLHHTFLQTPPEITSRDVLRYTIKTSDPKISSRMFDLCRNGSPYYTACFGKHILNPHPKIHHQNKSPKISSHMCDFGRNSSPYYTAHFGKHILNQHHKVHHKTSNPKIPFYASLFWNLWEQLPKIAPRISANPSKKKTSRDDQRYTIKTSDPKISSHIFFFTAMGLSFFGRFLYWPVSRCALADCFYTGQSPDWQNPEKMVTPGGWGLAVGAGLPPEVGSWWGSCRQRWCVPTSPNPTGKPRRLAWPLG